MKPLLVETGPEAGEHHFGHGLELGLRLWGNARERDTEVVALRPADRGPADEHGRGHGQA